MRRSLITLILFILSFTSFASQTQHEKQESKSIINQKDNKMNSHISIFEIPATDISRAINFYQSILNIHIEKIDMPEMEMGILPYENQVVVGIIVKGKDSKPSANGTTVYLNGGNNLQIILDKVEKNNGNIIIPKTLHADGEGYFALFIDSEGNKIGLHSPN